MSDVRRLNLEAQTPTSVSAVPESEYALDDVKLATFTKVLEELDGMDYWSPVFQAWLPLVNYYLRSGVNKTLAGIWLNRINDKIKLMGPKAGQYTDVFLELLRMNRTNEGEAFADFSWAQIESFFNWVPILLDNEKIIFSTLLGEGFIRNELDELLQYKKVDGLSPRLHEAVYLYRHCQLDCPSDMTGIKQEIDSQCRIYADKFSAAFEAASTVCDGASRNVYSWYRLNIKQLICNAWLTSTDLSGTRNPLTRDDVMGLPIWLSENITDYMNDLPCICDLQVNSVYTFNALQSVLSPMSAIDDGSSLYAYTLPRSTIRNLLTTLNTFHWDIRQGTFFQDLYRRVEVTLDETCPNTKLALEDYVRSLISRGFPVKG